LEERERNFYEVCRSNGARSARVRAKCVRYVRWRKIAYSGQKEE